jgi:hypothetical protein
MITTLEGKCPLSHESPNSNGDIFQLEGCAICGGTGRVSIEASIPMLVSGRPDCDNLYTEAIKKGISVSTLILSGAKKSTSPITITK